MFNEVMLTDRIYRYSRYLEGDPAAACVLAMLEDLSVRHSHDEFAVTTHRLATQLGVSIDVIKRVKPVLEDAGFITTTRRGLPARLYYTVDHTKLGATL